MTQQAIFELLLQNNSFINDNRNHIYPTLIPESVDNISTKLTDMLYDSLKAKSLTSTTRRNNLLKFLQNIISHSNSHHVTEDNYSCILKHLECGYKKTDEIGEYLQRCQQEVNKNKLKLYEKITNEQRARNLKQKELNIQREFKAHRIQLNLSSIGIVCDLPHSETVYQHNEVIIKNIFGIDEKTESIIKYDSEIQHEKQSLDYRLKQVKFGYAINNIGTNLEVERYTEIIGHNLGSYEELYDFEKTFLKYLFKNKDTTLNYSTLCNKFFYILEIDIIEICTQIVQLDDPCKVNQVFQNIVESEEFIYLKAICNKDKYLCLKIENVFYNLYGLSFCNVNILKFIKLLHY